MQVLGVDPHKGSHTAAAVAPDGTVLGRTRVVSSRRQAQRLIAWAAPWPERVWAVEGASGIGRLLAQQLVAAGEPVLDVPAALATRVRVLSGQSGRKTDAHDAVAVATAAIHHPRLRARCRPRTTTRCCDCSACGAASCSRPGPRRCHGCMGFSPN